MGLTLAAACTSPVRAQVALTFTSVGSTSYLDAHSRMLGWQFTVNQNFSVSAFGWFDWNQDGLSASHQIGLWDTAGSTLLASVTIPSGTAAALTGDFRYVSLGSNLALQTGHTYMIAGFDPGSNDQHVWDAFLSGYNGFDVAGFSSDSRINLTVGNAIGNATGSFGFPSGVIGDSRSALMGPNFLIAIPEPATVGLVLGGLVLALGVWRRKSA